MVVGTRFSGANNHIFLCYRSSCNDSKSGNKHDWEIIVVECKTLSPVANPEG